MVQGTFITVGLRRWLVPALVLAFLVSCRAAIAAEAGGHGALALAVIAGQYDPALSPAMKAGLLRLLADEAFGTGTISVKAAMITCRAGDVDLKAYSCALTYGTRSVNLKGRQAAELFATLAEAGVASDGAAGTIYEGVKNLSCTLMPTELGGPGAGDGGGAACTYQPG